jgi:DNA repair exonuclease SbcCD ATPase subunit
MLLRKRFPMFQQTTGEGSDLGINDAAAQIVSLMAEDGGDAPAEENQDGVQAVATDETDDMHDVEDLDEADDDGAGDETPADDEGESEGEEDDAVEDTPEPRYRVKVDGEEVEVTLDELQRGYSRQADYTRKTQEIAQQRKSLEQELEQARAERTQYAQTLETLRSHLETFEQSEPKWDELYEQDPIGAMRKERQWKERKEKIEAVKAEQARLKQQEQQELQQRLAMSVAEHRQRLLEALPDWNKPEVAAKERKVIADYMKDRGFTDDELNQVFDHRVVLVARDAARYRQMQQKRKNLRPGNPAGTPRTATPGAAQTPADRNVNTSKRAKQRLAQTGRVEDAARLLETML